MEEEKQGGKKFRIKVNGWKIATVVLALLAIVLLVKPGGFTGMVTAEKAAGNAVSYINENLVQTGEAEFVSVKDSEGFYEVTVSYMGRESAVYVSKDGEYLFLGAPLNLGEALELPSEPETQSESLPKTDKPSVKLFLMSFCPYGNKAEDTMLPVYNLLGDKVDWNIHYIVSVSGSSVRSLHGQPEVDQNEREACVLDEYGLDEWWTFTTYVNKNCGSDGSCWEDAASEAGVDVDKVKTCVVSRGLDLMKESMAASSSAGASGSPTLMINDVESRSVYQYGNPEAYKQAICSAFNNPPGECSEELGSPGSSSESGGSC